MHEWRRDVVLKLDDGEPECGDGHRLCAINRAVPLEFSGGCHAELVGEVPPLVMVLMETK